MYQTTYHRPSSVDEAAALFAKGSDAKYLAGGHTLIPVMKQRLASPSDVIDLGKIKELIGIEATGDAMTIKAATTHYDVATSGAVQKAIPALAHLASLIGDPAVRISRHHRRLDRQQRSRGGLSGGGAGARCHREDQQALDLGR